MLIMDIGIMLIMDIGKKQQIMVDWFRKTLDE